MAERIVGRPWTTREDRLLVDAVAIHGRPVSILMFQIQSFQYIHQQRWLHSLSPNVKKSAWTPEEDHLLLELYQVHSTKWSVIARHIPGRTDDACSKRYREALDPSLRRDEWSKEEDCKLLDAYSRLLGRWGQVGQELQRSGLACRNRWRLLERKRTSLPLTDSQSVDVSNSSLTMSLDHSSPTLTYTHSPPWPTSPVLDSRHYWQGNPSHFDTGPSSASGQQFNNVRSHNDVGLLGSVESSSVSHPESIQHVVNLPPPFHYSSSSLSSALSSPHTLANRYAKSTAASGGCYHAGEPCAAPLPIASAAPADNTSAVFSYGVDHLDPSLVNTSQSTQGRHTVYDNVARGQYDGVRLGIAPTPAASPVPAQRASEYYSPALRHNERKGQPVLHQLIGDGEASPSKLPRDPYYSHPTTSQGPLSLVPSGLGPIHEANGNYYATHRRQQLEHDLRHFVMPPSDPPAVSNVHREYYASPSSSDLCSPVSSVDTASCQHYQYYPPSEHAVPAHQDISPLSRPATATPDGCGDYYRTQPKGQPQLQFHSLPNEPELTLHRAPVPVSETAPPLAVPRSFYHVSPTQPSASVAPSAYALPKATGTVAKRGPPLDTSSPNPDDPNPRPASRPRSSVMRKRPDLHAPLRLSSDLPATNDSSIKPYACGHESCWPANTARSLACYTTSRGLSDHNKSAHPEDAGGDRPYRCGLEGCGKSWKSINGLQYHLQISKAHFQHAIVSTFVTSYIDGLTVPSVDYGEGDDKTKKQYSCPHQGCPNRYKQLSGLRYHLAHGHPSDLPVQLDLVPPALSRKLAEKMRKESASLQPPDA
ncbi:hypothetical protein AZE42_01116 [Rhizopogon vesiculosus]|uniref:Uncharacterized protein n=1 Tax=Rhizopogon vesiculosus TaxID=180088 RepID=A0A1J8PF27_9AGAM|nr:hypothetical protein AZE42_01116 [Rhizopogon vesiculosus]